MLSKNDNHLSSEQESNHVEYKPHRVRRLLLYLAALPLFCGLLCAATFWAVELRPQYIELSIPPSDEMVKWSYTERSVLEWLGGSRSFLWRQQTYWFPTEGQDWYTVWQYFDQHLMQLGWKRNNRFYKSCTRSFPEAEFLQSGNGGYVTYIPQEREDYLRDTFCYGPDICLAIWQRKSDRLFNVVVTSDNPSFLTSYGRCMG